MTVVGIGSKLKKGNTPGAIPKTISRSVLQKSADAPSFKALMPRVIEEPPNPWEHECFTRLTYRQQAFTRAYLTDANGNASAAIRLSGLDVTSVRATACQILKHPNVREAVSVLTPMVRVWEMWKIHAAAPVPAAPEVIVRGDVHAASSTDSPPPPMTRNRLLIVMAAMAEGRDPRWDTHGAEPAFPLILRAQDMIAAGKLWADLKGLRKQTTVVEGNPKKPMLNINADLRKMSHEEIREQLAELQERRVHRLAAAAPSPPDPAEPEKDIDK